MAVEKVVDKVNCPYCAESTRVIETRSPEPGRVARRRTCQACGSRFATTERISPDNLKVRKRSGSVEPFSRQKIARSILKAASGHTLLPAAVDAFVDRVVDRATPETSGLPIRAQDIGALVLECLNDNTDSVDVVRIRYAMVFLGRLGSLSAFRDVSDFEGWLEENYPPYDSPDLTTPGQIWVVKRDGKREPFELAKLERSVGVAAKGRGDDQAVRALATYVGHRVSVDLQGQSLVGTQQIAASVLRELMVRDKIAYLRYASITKRYTNSADFISEVRALAAIGATGETST